MSGDALHAVIVTPRAEADLDEIMAYIGETSLANAIAVYDDILSCLRSLGNMPRRFPIAPEKSTNRAEIRHTVVCGYRIVYSIIDAPDWRVTVETIRHAARLPAEDLATPE